MNPTPGRSPNPIPKPGAPAPAAAGGASEEEAVPPPPMLAAEHHYCAGRGLLNQNAQQVQLSHGMLT